METPVHLEHSGVYKSVRKRRDGTKLIPWNRGRVLICDVTCPDTFAPSHGPLAAKGAGLITTQAEERKRSMQILRIAY